MLNQARDSSLSKGVIQEACKAKIERDRRRGIKNRPIRAMVVGIPNVGKSTFINSYAGKACAKTGNKPGVTKGKQWIRLNKTLELLDTPGILWPKFEDQEVGKRLAFIGSIKDEILNLEELSLELLDYIRTNYPGLLNTRYGIEEEGTPVSLLEAVADKRKCLIRGQEIDYAKAAGIVMEEFRNGKIGRITLEFPPVEEETVHEDHPGRLKKNYRQASGTEREKLLELYREDNPKRRSQSGEKNTTGEKRTAGERKTAD